MSEAAARSIRGAPASRFGTALMGAGVWSVVSAVDALALAVGGRIHVMQFEAQQEQRYRESLTVDLDNMGSPLDVIPMSRPMSDIGHTQTWLMDGVQRWQHANPIDLQTASVSFLISASLLLTLTWFAVRLSGAMQTAGAFVAGFALVSFVPWFLNSLLYLSFTRFSVAWGFQLALHLAMLIGVYAAARMAARSLQPHIGDAS